MKIWRKCLTPNTVDKIRSVYVSEKISGEDEKKRTSQTTCPFLKSKV